MGTGAAQNSPLVTLQVTDSKSRVCSLLDSAQLWPDNCTSTGGGQELSDVFGSSASRCEGVLQVRMRRSRPVVAELRDGGPGGFRSPRTTVAGTRRWG